MFAIGLRALASVIRYPVLRLLPAKTTIYRGSPLLNFSYEILG